jgi:hypothetical protein
MGDAPRQAGSALAEEQCDATLQSLLCDDASHCFSSMDFAGPVVGKPRDRVSEKSDPIPVSDRGILTRCRITPELSRPAAGWQQRAA